MYTYVCVHIYMYMYIYVYICIHISVGVYIYAYIYTFMYIYIYVYMYIYIFHSPLTRVLFCGVAIDGGDHRSKLQLPANRPRSGCSLGTDRSDFVLVVILYLISIFVLNFQNYPDAYQCPSKKRFKS